MSPATSPAAKLFQDLALAAMNLTAEELDQLAGIARMPELGTAAELGWWLRVIAEREGQRRDGAEVEFPLPAFDFWTAGEAADNLIGAVQVATGCIDRLNDLAMSLLQIIALQAAVRLKEIEVIHAN